MTRQVWQEKFQLFLLRSWNLKGKELGNGIGFRTDRARQFNVQCWDSAYFDKDLPKPQTSKNCVRIVNLSSTFWPQIHLAHVQSIFNFDRFSSQDIYPIVHVPGLPPPLILLSLLVVTMYTQENVNVDPLDPPASCLLLASWGSTQLPSTQHTAFWMLRVLASKGPRCGEVSVDNLFPPRVNCQPFFGSLGGKSTGI